MVNKVKIVAAKINLCIISLDDCYETLTVELKTIHPDCHHLTLYAQSQMQAICNEPKTERRMQLREKYDIETRLERS